MAVEQGSGAGGSGQGSAVPEAPRSKFQGANVSAKKLAEEAAGRRKLLDRTIAQATRGIEGHGYTVSREDRTDGVIALVFRPVKR